MTDTGLIPNNKSTTTLQQRLQLSLTGTLNNDQRNKERFYRSNRSHRRKKRTNDPFIGANEQTFATNELLGANFGVDEPTFATDERAFATNERSLHQTSAP